jgi:hypothetical protein
MNGIRFERIQFSILRHETDAARATSRFLTSLKASAPALLAGTVIPCALGESLMRVNMQDTRSVYCRLAKTAKKLQTRSILRSKISICCFALSVAFIQAA